MVYRDGQVKRVTRPQTGLVRLLVVYRSRKVALSPPHASQGLGRYSPARTSSTPTRHCACIAPSVAAMLGSSLQCRSTSANSSITD